MLKVETQSFRVLVAGYINLNVIDGSAFFISGLASMLSELTSVEVGIVTANPVEKTDVLDEVMYRPNVTVIDPYSPVNRELFNETKTGKSMPREDFASLISKIGSDYDAILVRDTESAFHLANSSPELASRLFVYVTGIHTVGQEIDASLKKQLEEIHSAGAKFVCQTEYIETALKQVLPGISSDSVYILTPHVPDGEGDFEEAFEDRGRYDRFVYTGKFFEDWNTDKILASFKELNYRGCELSLDVAGDQFRHSKTNPGFVRNNRWLLDSTPGVHWYGRVPREQSRAIIENADIGIGWRSEALNESSELSTKILEYGILGRPSILNRTPLHERLLGADYPLFANSMQEFKDLLERIPGDRNAVKLAAERCYNLAMQYSYSGVRPGLLTYLGNVAGHQENTSSVRIDKIDTVTEELLTAKHKVLLRGQWADIQRDSVTSKSVGEQLEAVLEDQVRSRELEQALRERKELFLSQSVVDDLNGNFTPGAVGTYKSKSLAVGPGASESNIQKISRLEEQLKEAESLQQETQTRLRALQQSRLGRVQLEIWRQKRGSVSSSLPASSRLEGITRWLLSVGIKLGKILK